MPRILLLCCLLVLRSVPSASTAGLTFKLYNNAALAGRPSHRGITTTVSLSLAKTNATNDANGTNNGDCYLSGELLGKITFPSSGTYRFDCDFQNISTGWVWIDGHLVCRDEAVFGARREIDNPLYIRKNRHVFPFRAHITSQDETCQSIGHLQVSVQRQVSPQHYDHNRNGGDIIGRDDDDDDEVGNGNGRFGKASELVDDTGSDEASIGTASPFELISHDKMPITLNFTLAPHLPPAERQRDQLQRKLSRGWGSFLRSNLLSVVKLPDGLVLTPTLCRRSTGDCLDQAIPDDVSTVRVDLHAYDRSYVGYTLTHQNMTLNMEYSVTGEQQQYLHYLITLVDCGPDNSCYDFDIVMRARYAWNRPGTPIVFLEQDIVFVTPGFKDVNVNYVFENDDTVENGEVVADAFLFDYDDVGVERRNLRAPAERGLPSSYNGGTMDFHRIQLGKKATGSPKEERFGFVAGFSAHQEIPTMVQLESWIRRHQRQEQNRLVKRFGPKASVATAIQCAIMWTLVFNPVENLGVFMPVSRASQWSFGDKSGAKSSDWTYAIFDWDNLFASLLAGLDHKEIAYSNLFQVAKTKTAAGFIPNWATAGAKSQDRTEPPVGAKVALELFRKYNDTWVVEVVFQDLLDWNDWFYENRILTPRGLVGLGSYYEPPTDSSGPDMPDVRNTMFAARLESGLDNSPMYDGDLYDNETHMMLLYDVGMSSLVAQEAYSLAELAEALGKDSRLVKRLKNRGDVMRDLVWHYLWDPHRQVFANRFVTNSSFVQHISPTSFYPLSVGAGNTQQVTAMIQSYLFNSTRFCISPNGDFRGNDPDLCYWGLPSITADDPTYLKGWVYWRGYSWGPMAMLVYWSMQVGGAVHDSSDPRQASADLTNASDLVSQAREALCNQMEALMMSQWTTNRHICENYHPHRDAKDCSGTKFYHWGALNGLISMMEKGYW